MIRRALRALPALILLIALNAPAPPVAREPPVRGSKPGTAETMRLDAAVARLAVLEGARVSNDPRACPRPGRVYGAYCAARPDVIYVNSSDGSYPWRLRAGLADATARHELAHRRILAQCGTLRPARAANPEAMTSAWAVLFLGADAADIQTGRPAAYRIGWRDWLDAASVGFGLC